MKHLKSKISDLDNFGAKITLRSIAEPLMSFDKERDASKVAAEMKGRDFDVVGVRSGGFVVGYANCMELNDGNLHQHCRSFGNNLMPDSSPLGQAIGMLSDKEQLFVAFKERPWGIITKGDLQKIPVRMWMFGLVSLLEMQMMRHLRNVFHNTEWKKLLRPINLEMVQRTFKSRCRRNVQTDLIDCLTFGDKASIFRRNHRLLRITKLGPQEFGVLMGGVEGLRNDLAHSQDFLKGRWTKLPTLILDSEKLLNRLEKEL